MSHNTEESKKKVLEILKINPLISPACRKTNVAKSSFYRWIKEDKVFNKAVKASQMMGRAIICDAAESKVLSLLNSDNEEIIFKTAKYILNNLHPIYKSEKEGIQYQKSKLRDEIEKEKEYRKGDKDIIVTFLKILKELANENKDDKENNLISTLIESIEKTNKLKDDLINKNLEKSDFKDKIKKLI